MQSGMAGKKRSIYCISQTCCREKSLIPSNIVYQVTIKEANFFRDFTSEIIPLPNNPLFRIFSESASEETGAKEPAAASCASLSHLHRKTTVSPFSHEETSNAGGKKAKIRTQLVGFTVS